MLLISTITTNCSKDSANSATTTATGSITIENVSDLATADMQTWSTTAASKMSSQTSNILAVSWNVGAQVKEGGFNRPFNTHAVTITSEQIETLMTKISSWLDTSCADDSTKTEELANFRNYITNGADASAHLVMCGVYRIVLMAFPSTMSADDRKSVVIHEFYHAFQQDLADEACGAKRDSSTNGKWLVEGATEYFTFIELYGATAGVSKLLEKALEAYNSDNDTAITGSSITHRAGAGIRYMIEKGWITESSILDGSFFHSCITESDYTDTNANIVTTKANWYKIEATNGVYGFTAAALGG